MPLSHAWKHINNYCYCSIKHHNILVTDSKQRTATNWELTLQLSWHMNGHSSEHEFVPLWLKSMKHWNERPLSNMPTNWSLLQTNLDSRSLHITRSQTKKKKLLTSQKLNKQTLTRNGTNGVSVKIHKLLWQWNSITHSK